MNDQALAGAALRVAQNWPRLLREAVENIQDLRRQLAEAEARAERAEQAAAEAEAREAELRGALEGFRVTTDCFCDGDYREKHRIRCVDARAALALPHDGSALAAVVERARSEEREAIATVAEESARQFQHQNGVKNIAKGDALWNFARDIHKRGEG